MLIGSYTLYDITRKPPYRPATLYRPVEVLLTQVKRAGWDGVSQKSALKTLDLSVSGLQSAISQNRHLLPKQFTYDKVCRRYRWVEDQSCKPLTRMERVIALIRALPPGYKISAGVLAHIAGYASGATLRVCIFNQRELGRFPNDIRSDKNGFWSEMSEE